MVSGVCFRIKQALHAFAWVGVLVAGRVADERRLVVLKLSDGYIQIYYSFLEIRFSIETGRRRPSALCCLAAES